MQPTTPQRPSLGRVVLYTSPKGHEYAADIVYVDEGAGELALHVKSPNQARPIDVQCVPFLEGEKGPAGQSWRWPPRV